jgi:hypothetical protein
MIAEEKAAKKTTAKTPTESKSVAPIPAQAVAPKICKTCKQEIK